MMSVLTNITSEYRTWTTAQVSIREAGGQARANLGHILQHQRHGSSSSIRLGYFATN